jgi:hypothetical protein
MENTEEVHMKGIESPLALRVVALAVFVAAGARRQSSRRARARRTASRPRRCPIALPKGRPAALAYVSEFVEQSKKSGTVQRAIDAAKLRGVSVAP